MLRSRAKTALIMQGLPLFCTAFLLAREKTNILQFRVVFEVPTKQLTSKAANMLVAIIQKKILADNQHVVWLDNPV